MQARCKYLQLKQNVGCTKQKVGLLAELQIHPDDGDEVYNEGHNDEEDKRN